MRLLALSFLLAASASAAQEADSVGVLTGVVIDAETSEPVSGLVVRWLKGAAETRSDSMGHFSLDSLPFGRHDLLVQSDPPGLYREVVSVNVIGDNEAALRIRVRRTVRKTPHFVALALLPDSTRASSKVGPDDCDVPMAEVQGTLYGRVADSRTGEPLVGANVFIPEIQRGAATGSDGCYAIREIRDGIYTVRFSYAGYSEVEVGDVEAQGGRVRTLDAHLSNLGLCPAIICDCFQYPWGGGIYKPRVVVQKDYDPRKCGCDCGSIDLESLPIDR